jgi:3'(2'), 5'-bisphosphate nucleotidase
MNRENELFKFAKVPLEAAIEASNAIMEIYQTEFDRVKKADGSPVTLADITSSNILHRHLNKTQIPITGEEHEKAPFSERKKWAKSWCIDPLDGTKEFIKKNGEFVINIALIEGEQATFGLIASPVSQKIILGGPQYGAFQLNFEDVKQPAQWRQLDQLGTIVDPITIISSRSHYTGDILPLIHSIENTFSRFESIKMGSALKFFHLVKGEADVYPRFAPTMEWDIAAGHAIFEAIGGEIINVKTGDPLRYNKEDLVNPYFIAYNKHVPKKVIYMPK